MANGRELYRFQVDCNIRDVSDTKEEPDFRRFFEIKMMKEQSILNDLRGLAMDDLCAAEIRQLRDELTLILES